MSHARPHSSTGSSPLTAIALILVCVAMLFAACSSGSSDGPGDAAAGTEGSTDPSDGGGDGTLPLGTAWETFAVAEFDGLREVTGITTLGDSVWVTGARWNAPVLWRSTDGETWEEIEVAPPGADQLRIDGILEWGDGGYLAFGQHKWQCFPTEGSGDYLGLIYCKRERPVIALSEDGETWRVTEPAAMATPGDQSTVIRSVSTYAGGYVAVGTVKGPDWHGRVWTSPDGEDWTMATELRGEVYTTGVQVLSDGERVVVLAAEHECSEPRDISQGGWVMGTASGNHLRIYEGTDPAALTLSQPGEHPLAPEPMRANCDEVMDVELSDIPYTWARGLLVDGMITLVEREAPEDTDEDETRVRRIASLVDGEWLVDEVELPLLSSGSGYVVEFNGAVGIVGDGGPSRGIGLGSLWAAVPTEAGSWEHRDATYTMLWNDSFDATYFDGALLMVGELNRDPFSTQTFAEAGSTLLVARSQPTTVAEWNACVLEAGAVCQSIAFEVLEGAPDFAGTDLSSVDLTASNLSRMNFDGASFREATLVGVVAADASFADTDFSGADLRGANLEGVVRADFSDARLDGAEVHFSDAITLDGSSLARAWLRQTPYEPGQYRSLELSLAGLDLRRARIVGGYEGALLVITDLRGSMVESTSFGRVDLSRADVTGVDLSQLSVDEDSICPSGQPPVSESSFRSRCE